MCSTDNVSIDSSSKSSYTKYEMVEELRTQTFNRLVELLNACADREDECRTCLRREECLELWDEFVINRVVPNPREELVRTSV